MISSYKSWVWFYNRNLQTQRLEPIFEDKITVWICFYVLWIHKVYFVADYVLFCAKSSILHDQAERHHSRSRFLLIHYFFLLPSFLGGKRKGENNKVVVKSNAFLLDLLHNRFCTVNRTLTVTSSTINPLYTSNDYFIPTC